MSKKNKEVIKNENTVQAIVIADTFGDEFVPISNDIPHVSSKYVTLNDAMNNTALLGPFAPD